MFAELLRKHCGDDEAEDGKRTDDDGQDRECGQQAKKMKMMGTESVESKMHPNVNACEAVGAAEKLDEDDAEPDDQSNSASPSAPVDSSEKPNSNADVKRIQSSPEYDPTCKDCVQPTRDPNTQELVMFLHALRYSGPDFDFSTPLPEWATEDWNEEDEWKLY